MVDGIDLPLGKAAKQVCAYTPSLLRAIERDVQREPLGLGDDLPFLGEDIWNCYELSWLTPDGMPAISVLRIQVPASSPALVESKSLKLYLNSFSQTRFQNRTEVLSAIDSDLGVACRAPVMVSLVELGQLQLRSDNLAGQSLDGLAPVIDAYERDPSIPDGATDEVVAKETLHTNLFGTLCPVTGQPDWASLLIEYQGPRIDHHRLIAYLVSYRRHQAFHETAIEQIFVDLLQQCACERLTVYGRFLRRGGIDINPFRSTDEQVAPVMRLARQ